MSAKTILNFGTGKMSTFGGPADTGVGKAEGLALLHPGDITDSVLGSLFLPQQPPGTSGLARRLNPRALYGAFRWDEVLKPFGLDYNGDLAVTHLLRAAMIRFTNPSNGACLFARPVDYGPGDGKVVDGKRDADTDRLADMSPESARILGLDTDSIVIGELVLPKVEP